MSPANFIDPTAVVHHNSKVWHYARILAHAVIHENVSIGSGVEIGSHSEIRSGSRIGAGTFLPSHSFVGCDVFIGPNVTFCDDRYPRVNNHTYKAEPPVILNNASIGAGSTILPGVTIGSYAVIGAGSVVTKSVPPHTTFYGPAATLRATPSEMADSTV